MGERTRDIYEQIASYPKPPLVPLLAADDPSSLQELGIKTHSGASLLVKAVLTVTGFRRFHKQLPDKLEGLLRETNLRGSYLFAPVVSATLALQDDPRNVSPLTRAATLIMAVRSLHRDLNSGVLPPDEFRGQILEMGQYPNLFSTSLIVEGRRPRIFKSTNVSQIIIAIGRKFYSLQIGDLTAELTPEKVEKALFDLVQFAQGHRLRSDEPTPGILTCAEHTTQVRAFDQLQKSKVNRESLFTLRHSFFTLCLDLESRPASYAEAAYMGHSGNCANRWFHSSLQLVVFGNAKACVICNFSAYLDGNTMMRAAAELQRRACDFSLPHRVDQDSGFLPVASELKWQIRPVAVQKAWKNLRRVLDNQQATFEIPSFGKSEFSTLGLDPVPTFIIALQMTTKRLTGRIVKISQFLTMSKYRCMDLVTAVVTTPEVIHFVEYMEAGTYQMDETQRLLRAAIDSQAMACRTARQHLPLPEIIALFMISRRGVYGSLIRFILMFSLHTMRMLRLVKPDGRREVIVSHPEIYREVPVVGRPGIRLPYVKYFGLHYQIWEDRTVVTMMPSTCWDVPNAEFIAELQDNLRRIKTALQ